MDEWKNRWAVSAQDRHKFIERAKQCKRCQPAPHFFIPIRDSLRLLYPRDTEAHLLDLACPNSLVATPYRECYDKASIDQADILRPVRHDPRNSLWVCEPYGLRYLLPHWWGDAGAKLFGNKRRWLREKEYHTIALGGMLGCASRPEYYFWDISWLLRKGGHALVFAGDYNLGKVSYKDTIMQIRPYGLSLLVERPCPLPCALEARLLTLIKE